MTEPVDERRPELRSASLSDIAARELPRPDMVTLVIQQQPKPEAQAQYEQWLKRIIPVAARFPGHRGVNVIRPGAGTQGYTVAVRFDTLEHAEDWLRSEARRQLVAEVEPLLDRAETLDTVTGLEFWFAPIAGAQPRARPYKQFLITLSVIYPLTLIVPWAAQPLLDAVPLLNPFYVRHLIVTGAIVGLITYVVMPRYVRWVARWLYR
jgi:antibiotic biosynthesis monooxygenase (ABM) superfamily enzyme